MNIVASVSPVRTEFAPLLFSGNLEEGIEILGDIGYDGIEISLRDSSAFNFRDLEVILARTGMRLFSIATGQSYVEDGYALCSGDASIRDHAIARMKDHINAASEYEAAVIIGGIRGKFGNTGEPLSTGDSWKNAIYTCAEYADKKHVRLLLEAVNRYEVDTLRTIGETGELIRSMGFDNVMILADTYHMNIEEAHIPEAIKAEAEYIGVLHCADSNRLAPGKGHINFQEIMGTITDVTKLLYLGVEVLPAGDGTAAAAAAYAHLKSLI